jgi:hypothetical protein
MGIKRTTFQSVVFQWPATPENPQWIEGAIVGDQSPEQVRCSGTVQYPLILVTGPGGAILKFSP